MALAQSGASKTPSGQRVSPVLQRPGRAPCPSQNCPCAGGAGARAQALLSAGGEITDTHPQGNWVLAPDPRGPRVVHGREMGGEPHSPGRGSSTASWGGAGLPRPQASSWLPQSLPCPVCNPGLGRGLPPAWVSRGSVTCCSPHAGAFKLRNAPSPRSCHLLCAPGQACRVRPAATGLPLRVAGFQHSFPLPKPEHGPQRQRLAEGQTTAAWMEAPDPPLYCGHWRSPRLSESLETPANVLQNHAGLTEHGAAAGTRCGRSWAGGRALGGSDLVGRDPEVFLGAEVGTLEGPPGCLLQEDVQVRGGRDSRGPG